jgi:hypothetical protein
VSESPGLDLDVEAFMQSEREFERMYGAEARRRWWELGAPPRRALDEQQEAAIRAHGADAAVWAALQWEVACRIEIVERARRRLKAQKEER